MHCYPLTRAQINPFAGPPLLFLNAQTQISTPRQRGNWGEKKRLLGQLDSIFKASTGTFEFKVTLTRLGAAVGMQLRVFNAANAFS